MYLSVLEAIHCTHVYTLHILSTLSLIYNNVCVYDELQMDKVRAKAKAWEAEFQRTCHTKKAVCIGCVWLCASEEEERGKMTDEVTFLAQFSALILTETAPVKVEPTPSIISLPDTHGQLLYFIDYIHCVYCVLCGYILMFICISLHTDSFYLIFVSSMIKWICMYEYTILECVCVCVFLVLILVVFHSINRHHKCSY